MKRGILISLVVIFASLIFASCTSNNVSAESLKNKCQIVEIDGCEYILYSETQGYSGYGFLSHKGNCKNPIHYK